MDWNRLQEHIANGLVNAIQHDHLPLTLYNYTQRCQFERAWDEVTKQCRGLICHGKQVVARPFAKFFNDGEHSEGEIPWHLPCEVSEKMDGSLLIVFHFDGAFHFATRGSFTSEQAAKGREIFWESHSVSSLDPNVTYLFEVLYPSNRIVVDYGNTEAVVLLAMIDTASGIELTLDAAPAGFNIVRRLPPSVDAKALRSIIRDDEEGYVVLFANGFRMKIKGERYMQLHKLICGLSSRSIWEALSESRPLDEMLAIIPDEFGEWAKQERAAMLEQFDAINCRTEEAYLTVRDLLTRKEQALKILADFADVRGPAFAALDGRPTAKIIWQMIYPEYCRPEVVSRMEG